MNRDRSGNEEEADRNVDGGGDRSEPGGGGPEDGSSFQRSYRADGTRAGGGPVSRAALDRAREAADDAVGGTGVRQRRVARAAARALRATRAASRDHGSGEAVTPFELGWRGGATEARLHRVRPGIEALPWG